VIEASDDHSSPGPSVRPIAREIENSSVVAFCPKTTSSESEPRKSAAATRASAISRSVSTLVAKTPWVFELLSRR
jgi:hypothetical protein